MSQPGPPEQGRPRTDPQEPPGTLDQTAQQNLIQQLGRALLRSGPPAWNEVSVEYRAVGGHAEIAAQLVAPNGTLIPLTTPDEVRALFSRLRHGMHESERGTWLSAIYRLRRPSSYSVDFNGDYEPTWQTPPPKDAFAEELHHYPRTGENIPGWLAQRAGVPDASGSATRAPALRTAEVFDAVDQSGRPQTNRAEVNAAELDGLADYLDQAPLVLAARSYDTDQLDPEQPASVPLTFHTDGAWIWPGAVAYYLRKHGVPPEDELVEHIRKTGFRVPEVDEHVRELAVTVITGEEHR
ncbi:MAG: hypothetical protein IJH84_13920 [Saccharopolyspora sp.]|uniref:hypothetical protein n=1 Tax=Saccharopolyspora sp. TaxID=33915 RepID=UPI0025D13735|nr:hypothetical protein [Saccharopolyspora sp.]MBQ6642111.1 hypothetical protein [Saccharopolyspora sp.]